MIDKDYIIKTANKAVVVVTAINGIISDYSQYGVEVTEADKWLLQDAEDILRSILYKTETEKLKQEIEELKKQL